MYAAVHMLWTSIWSKARSCYQIKAPSFPTWKPTDQARLYHSSTWLRYLLMTMIKLDKQQFPGFIQISTCSCIALYAALYRAYLGRTALPHLEGLVLPRQWSQECRAAASTLPPWGVWAALQRRALHSQDQSSRLQDLPSPWTQPIETSELSSFSRRSFHLSESKHQKYSTPYSYVPPMIVTHIIIVIIFNWLLTIITSISVIVVVVIMEIIISIIVITIMQYYILVLVL